MEIRQYDDSSQLTTSERLRFDTNGDIHFDADPSHILTCDDNVTVMDDTQFSGGVHIKRTLYLQNTTNAFEFSEGDDVRKHLFLETNNDNGWWLGTQHADVDTDVGNFDMDFFFVTDIDGKADRVAWIRRQRQQRNH